MTVTELRQRLQELEARGDGELLVLMNDREVVERAVAAMAAGLSQYCVLQGTGERLYPSGVRTVEKPMGNGYAQYSGTIPLPSAD